MDNGVFLSPKRMMEELWVEWRHGEVGKGSSWFQTEPLGGRGGSASGWRFLCPLASGTGLSQLRPCHPCPTKHSSFCGVSNPSRVGGFLEAVLSSVLFLCYPTPFLSLPAAITAPTLPSPFVLASRTLWIQDVMAPISSFSSKEPSRSN